MIHILTFHSINFNYFRRFPFHLCHCSINIIQFHTLTHAVSEGHLRNWIVYTFVCQSEWTSKRQSCFQFFHLQINLRSWEMWESFFFHLSEGLDKSDNWFIDQNHVLDFFFREIFPFVSATYSIKFFHLPLFDGCQIY